MAGEKRIEAKTEARLTTLCVYGRPKNSTVTMGTEINDVHIHEICTEIYMF